jgi:preprotein translocase subunit SecY
MQKCSRASRGITVLYRRLRSSSSPTSISRSSFNPDDIADNMRKNGSFIPGIRPGRRTSDYINDILTRITLVGALYLILISLVPTVPDLRLPPEPSVAGRALL